VEKEVLGSLVAGELVPYREEKNSLSENVQISKPQLIWRIMITIKKRETIAKNHRNKKKKGEIFTGKVVEPV